MAGHDYDVAVVGCGPVGALAANLLAKAGLSVLVLEKAQSPHPLPRAVHLDHEMMRIFQSAGLIGRLEPLMRATQGHVHIGADGGVIRYLGAAGRPKPFGWANDYFFYQPELEAELRAGLERFPHAELKLGVEVQTLTHDDRGVTLSFRHAEGADEQIIAAYVIGADGASSAVRRMVGVELDDLKFEEPWLVVDAEVEGPISFPDIPGAPESADLQQLSVMWCNPSRPATIVPGRGSHRRWEFMLLPGESDAEMMQPETVRALVAPWVRGSEHRIIRAATYRFHGLVAEHWRVGRVFLAGDAAHQTPPFFGQGMCHGMRDAANLAWKLALVIGGEAAPGLLDTYQPEREPHVRAVIGAAVAAGRYICMLDPEAAAERDQRLREAMKDAAPTTAADLIPPLAAGVAALGAPGAGERFIQPLVIGPRGRGGLLDEVTGGGFVLLAADPGLIDGLGAKPKALLQRLGVRAWSVADADATEAEEGQLIDCDGHLSAWLQRHSVSAVLIRPDFYAYGAAADAAGLDALLQRLDADLRLRPAAALARSA